LPNQSTSLVWEKPWKLKNLDKEKRDFLYNNRLEIDFFNARNNYVNSIPLLAVGSVVTAAGLGWFCYGIVNNGWVPLYAIVGSTYLAAGCAILIPGIVLHVKSKKTFDNIVSEYTQQHVFAQPNDVRLQFGVAQNGIGLQINF
ncbi:MAG: hypothetical protein LBU51_07295, partial [Bacteroidales bacterium]|nr:hypothetical protein [Bacteroidales bacterium]